MGNGLKDVSSRFLAERHGLLAFIYGLVRDPGAAEDVFQEVWLRLAEAVERGIHVEDPARWSRGVARNLILHRWREKRTAPVVVDSELVDIAERAFDEDERSGEERAERSRALEECVRGLPPESKRLLALKYETGLTAAGVAERLKKTAAGVMMTLSRVRRALAGCIERRLRAGEAAS